MSATTRPIRIGCYSASLDKNPYLRLFYSALAEHGIERVQLDPRISLDPTLLSKEAVGLDGVYFHWVETLWRTDPKVLPWRARAIPNLLRLNRVRSELQRLRRNGTAVFWTMHNLDPHEPDTFVDELGHRLFARIADLKVCHSRAIQEEALRRYGGDSSRTLLMYHGNYEGVFGQQAQLRVRAGAAEMGSRPRTLLLFGNIREYKGADLAVEAVRKLGADYSLVVAGKPMTSELEAELQSRAAGMENVRLELRYLSNEELSSLIDSADAVLLPYRASTGSGAMLAALSCGRGVIAADLPYFREILEFEPDAGVLHEVGDVAELCEAIGRFYSRPVADRAAAARELSKRFSWRSVVEPVVQGIRQVVSSVDALESA